MTDLELQTLADIVKRSTEEKIKSACTPLLNEITLLKGMLAALPVPKDGRDGKDGIDGKDAPEAVFDEERFRDAVLPMLQQVLERDIAPLSKTLASLPIPKDGKDGNDGKDGATPHPDTIALMVRDAIDKRISELPAPKDGALGPAGKDAAQIEILSSIDETRSYPQGTYATYNHGIMRAYRNTDPMTGDLVKDGWQVLVPGPTIEVVQKDDLRSFDVVITYTGGRQTTTTLKTPISLYRNVWTEGKEYSAGDQVSLGGSTWHCNADNCKSKPSTNPKDWTMMTKRGQDGKDFRPPELPSPPKPIRLS